VKIISKFCRVESKTILVMTNFQIYTRTGFENVLDKPVLIKRGKTIVMVLKFTMLIKVIIKCANRTLGLLLFSATH
jgi:ribosomal protein S4E